MSKIKTKDDLIAYIDKLMAQRRLEIHYLKSILESKKGSKENTVLSKALILISYSHFEGFIKEVSSRYLDYVNFLSLPRKELSLKMNAVLLAWIGEVPKKQCKKDTTENILEYISNDNSHLKFESGPLTNPESNLKSDVLLKIINNVGGQDNCFDEGDIFFLENKLLKYRNCFAHGDNNYIKVEDAIKIANKTLNLMSKYKDMIENMIAVEIYKRNPIAHF